MIPLTITRSHLACETQPTLIFRNSSEIARRGSCSVCDTSLLMDYEWFEPNTLWLVNPVWHGLKVAELGHLGQKSRTLIPKYVVFNRALKLNKT